MIRSPVVPKQGLAALEPPVLAFALALALALTPGRAEGEITIRDLVGTAEPSNIAFAEDGRRLAFEVESADLETHTVRRRIHLLDSKEWKTLRGIVAKIRGRPESKERFHRPVTREDEDATSPAFSPGGDLLSFLSARGEGALRQVWILPFVGGEAIPWTDLPEGVESYAWRPDGSMIVLSESPPPPDESSPGEERIPPDVDAWSIERERRPKVFWLIPPDGEGARRIHAGDPGIGEYALSFDGERIAFASNGTGDPADRAKSDLYVLEIATGEVRRILDRPGPERFPRWSNDGEVIYFLAALDSTKSRSQANVYAVPAAGGEWELISERIDRDVVEIATGKGSDRILAILEDGTNEVLARLFPNSRIVKRVHGDPGRVRHLAGHSSGRKAAFVHEGPDRAPEVCTWTFDDDYIIPVTDLNREISSRVTAESRVIRWSTSDGGEVEGVLVLPGGRDDSSPLPTILCAGEGPGSNTTNTLRTHRFHAWSSRGYAVLGVNPRGSSGYGADFNVAGAGDPARAGLTDLMAGVDHLVAEGIADPERLGILGGLWRGSLAYEAIAATDRFAAAVSLPDPDVLPTHHESESDADSRDDSPETVATPVLALHGAADDARLADLRRLHAALEERGAEVELVVYPREGTSLTVPSHRIDAFERAAEWFDRHLQGRPAAGIGRPVTAGPWSLRVRSVEHVPPRNEPAPRDGHLSLELVLSSDLPVVDFELVLTGRGSPFKLHDAAGWVAQPIAVPVDWPGEETLIEGSGQRIRLDGDPRRGTASWPIRVAFSLENLSSPAAFHALDCPPVRISWPTPEAGEPGNAPDTESNESEENR
jgi:dipeptidyl aminopeptidase/acylaminoacyl peptidase